MEQTQTQLKYLSHCGRSIARERARLEKREISLWIKELIHLVNFFFLWIRRVLVLEGSPGKEKRLGGFLASFYIQFTRAALEKLPLCKHTSRVRVAEFLDFPSQSKVQAFEVCQLLPARVSCWSLTFLLHCCAFRLVGEHDVNCEYDWEAAIITHFGPSRKIANFRDFIYGASASRGAQLDRESDGSVSAYGEPLCKKFCQFTVDCWCLLGLGLL